VKYLFYEKGHEEAEQILEAETLDKAIEVFNSKLPPPELFAGSGVKVVPICPLCNARLDTILFQEGGSLEVKEDGSYTDGGQTSGAYLCYKCGKAIGGYGQENWGFNPETTS